MPRPVILLLVAALAAAAWWIAANAGPGDAPGPSDEDGLVVHVFIADRDGKPIAPAQVIQVYDEKRVKVDAQGYARLTNVTLRADEAPSAEAFTLALRLLARHHALRRGFAPTATKRDDGSWEVRYALHAHGILRVHVEAVNLGPSKAFLERDEPLQRWEPVGGHAVVRPGSVVDFRIYDGWDAPGLDGKVPVRLVGEPGSDGIIGVATQRVLVDAPSPGHTAQLKLVPEPVDPIAGLVRIKEGPPPPTLRGRMIVRQIEKDGTKVHLGEIPIDDAGEFVFQDAGAGKYELVAGLDFAPGLITTECEGGDYLELETVGRARWVELRDVGPGDVGARLAHPKRPLHADSLPQTIGDLLLGTWWESQSVPWPDAKDPYSQTGWSSPPTARSDDQFAVALPGPGAWSIHLYRAADADHDPANAEVEMTLGEDASTSSASVAWDADRRGRVRVAVDPEGWGQSRSVELEVAGRKRTVVKGARRVVEFANLPPRPPDIPHLVWARWADPTVVPMVVHAVPAVEGEPETLTVRARRGGRLVVRLTGARAASITSDLVLYLVPPDDRAAGPLQTLRLARRGSAPVWTSQDAALPGRHGWTLDLLAFHPARSGAAELTMLVVPPEDAFEGAPKEVEIRAGETTVLELELNAE